jgi:drug/metabolite transporter (DMT)-like permease
MGKSIGGAMNATEWALLLLLALMWGAVFFFGKLVLAELPPFTAVLGHLALAAAILAVLLGLTGRSLPRDGRSWRCFAAMGALNNVVPFGLIMHGQTQIGSGLASILNAVTPLSTVVLAHVLTRDERLTPARLAGVLLGLGGVTVMVGPAALAGLGRDVAAQAACLLATVSYGCAGIYGRRFHAQPSLVTATGQVIASTAMTLPIALLIDQPWTLPMPGVRTWLALGGAALFSTALGYVLYFRILATAGATNLLLVTFLMPVIAVLLGVLALGEVVKAGEIAGMALIAGGLATIDGRLLRRWRRGAAPG